MTGPWPPGKTSAQTGDALTSDFNGQSYDTCQVSAATGAESTYRRDSLKNIDESVAGEIVGVSFNTDLFQ